LEIRINPLPIAAAARTLDWACLAEQAEVAEWMTDEQHARRALAATFRWIDGASATLGHAVAEEFRAPELFFALLDDLNDRDWAILRSRLADESLEVSAARFSISRERVRQIESYVDRRVGRRLCAELRKGHPAAIGLGAHLGRLALTVTDAASKEQGKLLIEDRQDWIRKALPPDEALIMGAVERSLETLAPEDQSLLDHLSRVGQPLAGGRTTLPLTDADIERLRTTLDALAGPDRCAPLSQVAELLGIPAAEAALLALLADIKVEGGLAFVGAFQIADLRRARAAEILRSAGRAMHYAEILMAGFDPPMPPGWNGTNLVQAMRGEPDRFMTDDLGLWSLSGHATQEHSDLRPECPPLPPAPAVEGLRMRICAADRISGDGSLLGNLDPTEPGFVAKAAGRVADRLDAFPEGQRSVAEVLAHPDDHRLLRGWLAAPCDDPEAFDAELSDEAALGLVLACATLAVWREPRLARRGGWVALNFACGPEMRRKLFYEKGLSPQRLTTGALVRAAWRYGLRHAFDFRGDVWAAALGLQAGLDRHSLSRLSAWLDGDEVAPEAVRCPSAEHSGRFEAFANGGFGASGLAV